eukprot:16433851-Heterocapsa_arctica.AAC.2
MTGHIVRGLHERAVNGIPSAASAHPGEHLPLPSHRSRENVKVVSRHQGSIKQDRAHRRFPGTAEV